MVHFKDQKTIPGYKTHFSETFIFHTKTNNRIHYHYCQQSWRYPKISKKIFFNIPGNLHFTKLLPKHRTRKYDKDWLQSANSCADVAALIDYDNLMYEDVAKNHLCLV